LKKNFCVQVPTQFVTTTNWGGVSYQKPDAKGSKIIGGPGVKKRTIANKLLPAIKKEKKKKAVKKRRPRRKKQTLHSEMAPGKSKVKKRNTKEENDREADPD